MILNAASQNMLTISLTHDLYKTTVFLDLVGKSNDNQGLSSEYAVYCKTSTTPQFAPNRWSLLF